LGKLLLEHSQVRSRFFATKKNNKLHFSSFRPILLDPPLRKDVVVGAQALLECKFFGSPKPKVTWRRAESYKNMEVLNYEELPITADGVAQLRIVDVSVRKAELNQSQSITGIVGCRRYIHMRGDKRARSQRRRG
jgi:hypothetical protein